MKKLNKLHNQLIAACKGKEITVVVTSPYGRVTVSNNKQLNAIERPVVVNNDVQAKARAIMLGDFVCR